MAAFSILGPIVSLLLAGTSAKSADITFESLLREMTNLDALASVSHPRYRCKQFSSYNRKSTDPKVATDDNWFANKDRGFHIRQEERNGKTEWVMAEMAGPGAVVRIWSANANDAGIVRIYLDGQENPTIEMPMTDLLDGQHAPFLSPIAGVRAKGWNSFYPIPCASVCLKRAFLRQTRL